ncbi:MAG: autotransporter-associated beta strand repeat-containing protein, partial [Verrucomicrobiota bacterium]
MKITKRIHNSRYALKHLALAAALGIGLGTGTATADTTIITGQTVTVNNDAGAWAAGAGVVTINNGGTLYFDPTQGNYTLANDFIFAGNGGNINLTFKGNDTDYKLTGPMTSTATGAQTLAVITGNNNNGDRESVTFDTGIPNVGDSSALGLHVTFNTQSGSDSWVNLNAVNTFTGPITLVKGSNLQHGYLTIGGTITHFSGNSNGSGTLNSGNFPGAISLDATTFFNYASTAAQTLSGVISGAGNVQVTGGGTLTLSGTNTYSSDTTVSNGTLVLADGGALKFAVTNTSSNKVTGAGSATLDGAFTIDTSAVTAENGSWTLVNTTTKSFGSTFTMPGFSKSGTVFTKVDGTRTWTFDTTSAVLSLSSAGTIMTFGIPGAAAAIDNSALTIHLYVAADTDLATLAPTFTLSSGSCNQTSGSPPSPTFAAANPVHYIITDGPITNDYSVTVSASPLPMTGLTVWLKADAVVASDAAQVDGSGNVLQWNDSSGNSNNATKGSDQPAPTYVAGTLNGQPVLHFAQTGDNSGGRLYLGDLSASFPSEATIFAVGTVDNDNMYSMFGNSANDERWMGGNWREVTPGAFRGGRANFSSQYSQMPSSGSHIFAYESSS